METNDLLDNSEPASAVPTGINRRRALTLIAGDGVDRQLATVTGSTSAGYVARLVVGV